MRLDRQPIANYLQRNLESLVVHRPPYARAPDDPKEPSTAAHGGLPGRSPPHYLYPSSSR